MKELQIGLVLQCFHHTESNVVSPCGDGQPLQQLWLRPVQEPALPGDVQLYGEAHLGSEAGHAVLGPKRWPADTSSEHWWICSFYWSGSICSVRPPDTINWNIITNDKKSCIQRIYKLWQPNKISSVTDCVLKLLLKQVFKKISILQGNLKHIASITVSCAILTMCHNFRKGTSNIWQAESDKWLRIHLGCWFFDHLKHSFFPIW